MNQTLKQKKRQVEQARASATMDVIFQLARAQLRTVEVLRSKGVNVEDIPMKAEVFAILGIEMPEPEPLIQTPPRRGLIAATVDQVKRLVN